MPSVPVLIYDGHCSFCRIWLGYAQAQLGDGVEWVPSQEAGDRFSEIPREAFKESVYFVDSQGHISGGAEAIFAVLALVPGRAWPLRLYRTFRLFAWLCDSIYRVIAHHRDLAYTATRIAFGSKILPLRYGITESLFLRSLGLIFLFAFWSFHQQILALAGSRGIIPAARVLAGMRPELGSYPWLAIPSIFWWNASDAWLSGACSAGMAASLLLVISGWLGSAWQRLSILVCFSLYLSLITIGEPFTSFQWDALLLEAAFLALFAGTPLLVWPFRVLLFRLMFESGCVKLLSGDPNWRNLHALRFHFMTQPLPSPLAWYVYQTPGWLLDLFTLATLVIETICPFLLFFPRRVRHASAILLIGLQLLILVTGNYAFFNWLTIAICFWAFDDRTFSSLARFLRKAVARTPGKISRRVCSTVLAILMATGIAQVLSMFTPIANVPFTPLLALLRPWQIINSYGLFAVMTTTRPEITFEASNDG
jgi:predicted DCC family thiol-disulfide oxidoreductase YuxK